MTAPIETAPAAGAGERFVHLPYQRLLRAQPTYRWWRPLAASGILVAWILVVTTILSIVVMLVAIATGAMRTTSQADMMSDALDLFLPDLSRPETIVIGLVSVIIWLPGVPIALRLVGIRPAGPRVNVTHSVTFRLRLGWLARCLIPATVVSVGSIVVFLGIGVLTGEPLEPVPIEVAPYVVSLVFVLLLVPFQAATEEYVFRGVFMQALGSWTRQVWVPLVVPTALFALAHAFQYDVWGVLEVGVFGIAAAIATWRTGGLEAAIAMHALNNIVAFAVLGSGLTGGTGMTSTGSSPISIGFTLLSMAVFVLWVDRMAAGRGIARRSNIRIVEIRNT